MLSIEPEITSLFPASEHCNLGIFMPWRSSDRNQKIVFATEHSETTEKMLGSKTEYKL